MYHQGRHPNIDQFYIKNPLGLLQIIIVHALPTMQVKQITNNGENIKNKKKPSSSYLKNILSPNTRKYPFFSIDIAILDGSNLKYIKIQLIFFL